MKKSQIMAVFALALALGAVAPIAGVVGSASAIVRPNPTTSVRGEATCDELDCVVKNIEKDEEFIRITAMVNAYDAYKDAKYSDKVTTYFGQTLTQANVDTYINDITAKMTAIKAIEPTVSTAHIDDLDGIAVADLKLDDLKDAYQTGEGTFGFAQYLIIRDARVLTSDVTNAWVTLGGSRSDTLAAMKAHATYTAYKNLDAAITTAKDNYTLYKTHRDALRGAVSELYGKDMITYGGAYSKTGVEGLLDTDDEFPSLVDLSGIRNNLIKGGAYTAVVNAISNDFKTGLTDVCCVEGKKEDVHKNYTEAMKAGGLIDQFYAFKDYNVANNDDPTKEELLEILAKNCKTTNPGVEDTPSDADNTDADVNAPNTGILSSAEGSATTISIVAGLTTALASLGAGVVAYRSARRGE